MKPHKAALVAVAFFLVPLGGCLGDDTNVTTLPPGGTSEEPASSVIVEPAPGVFVAENKGILRGRVRDDVNYSIQDARVSILGTQSYATTGPGGTYRIDNVAVGNWTLRVEGPTQYRVHEGPVEIRAGQITERDVLLLPTSDRGAGYAPHDHDYWLGKDTYQLMDEEINPNQPMGPVRYSSEHQWTAQSSLLWPNTNETASPGLSPARDSRALRILLPAGTPSQPSTIIPGTREIHVTLSWNSATVTFPTLGFWYDSPAPKKNAVYLAKKPSGSTWTIPVFPEDADNGHQVWTFWKFGIWTGNDAQQPTSWQPHVFNGKVRVKMVLHRGNVPVEEEHPDWWGANQSILLRDGATAVTYSLVNGRLAPTFSVKSGLIVPPGTLRMRLEFAWTVTGAPSPQPAPAYSLAWTAGNQNPETTTFAAMQTQPTATSGNGFKTWDFQVPAAQTDAFYQTSSNWRFHPVFDHAGVSREFWENVGEVKYTLKVEVFKDPTFATPVA